MSHQKALIIFQRADSGKIIASLIQFTLVMENRLASEVLHKILFNPTNFYRDCKSILKIVKHFDIFSLSDILFIQLSDVSAESGAINLMHPKKPNFQSAHFSSSYRCFFS